MAKMKATCGRVYLDNLILVINTGSSSIKFAVYRGFSSSASQSVERVCCGALSGIGSNSVAQISSDDSGHIDISAWSAFGQLRFNNTEQAHNDLLEWLQRYLPMAQLCCIGYRIVHGGNFFDRPVIISTSVRKQLQQLVPLAPLHQPLGLNAVDVFSRHFPAAHHVACFDTAFHRTMPAVAQQFALPKSLREQGIKPYGFHGLSYQYIVSCFENGVLARSLPHRMVIAHLGSGASLCAVVDGKSMATTMSFTPLDGLPMSTRVGAIDAGAVLYLINELGMSAASVSDSLNKQSGLLGLSGFSGDMRELLASDSEAARFAVDYFCYRLCRELGALVSVMQGVDAIVFTGGVGANSWQIRERVAAQFNWLGLTIDSQANQLNACSISKSDSSITMYAIPTDEESLIATQVLSLNLPARNTVYE
jgi:acetate kinase